MIFQEIVLCERESSQNWSNRLFFINMTLYEIARTTSGGDREIYKRRLNESDVTEVRLTI